MELAFRRARREDVADIVALLADDVLGSGRERPGDPAYLAAFAAIDADANHLLVVAEQHGAVVGTLQLTFLPGLSLKGAWRAEIEGVRIAAGLRGRGAGRAMIAWAVDRARARGCRLVQLTTNAKRVEAQRFYEGLGFARSHVGFKLPLRD